MMPSSLWGRIVVFLILNFGALAIGSYFTGSGAVSEWYMGLNKAPWTPPGWFFGVAWTTIMLLFSVYMAILWDRAPSRRYLMTLYIIQWVLNVAWNPVFFHFHRPILALAIILSLTGIVWHMLACHWDEMRSHSYELLPYAVWLIIATSLNGYIIFFNWGAWS